MDSVPFKYRRRGYVHFDSPVASAVAESIATNATVVASHAFYPFIATDVVTQKIKAKAGGGVELKAPKIRIYAHYSDILSSLYEERLASLDLGATVTAFRALGGRSNIHFANEVFETIHGRPCSVATVDVVDFFNQLSHKQLKRALTDLLGATSLPLDFYKIFKAITEYCTVDREQLHLMLESLKQRDPRNGGRICSPREFRKFVRPLCRTNKAGKGIPQGSPISAVLANVYMLALDYAVQLFVTKHGGTYRRYCDDLVLVLPTIELREEAIALVMTQLLALGLTSHPDKMQRVEFTHLAGQLVASKPLNYLGFTFDGQHKRVRQASLSRYYKKMRLGVARAKAVRANIIRRGGPVTPLRRRKLHLLYTYVGRHNFPAYVYRAARIMNEPTMKKQVKAHWRKFRNLVAHP